MKRWFVLVCAILFILLSLTVQLRLDAGFDLRTTQWLQQVFPRVVDIPFSLFTIIGLAQVSVIVLGVLFLLYPRGARWQVVALFVLFTAIELIGKTWIDQPGPPHIYHRFTLPFPIPIFDVPTRYSFPSGHAGRSMFLVTVFGAWLARRPLGSRTKAILFALLVLGEITMLVSRVYLGEHWTTDVIGGALLGAMLAVPVALTETRAGSRM